MALQEARAGGRDVGRKGGAGEPDWAEEYRAEVARGERDAARQQGIFEARREELLAAHPGKHIAVCAGEVFAADTDREVTQMVMCAHPGRASFLYSPGCANVNMF